MIGNRKTVIVTGASQGIGAGIVKAFLARGYNVVGTARNATKSKELSASDHLALIDGNIGQFETAQKVAELAVRKFGSIDAVVANAGIFVVKPFTEYTADDFRALASTNLEGFIYIAQLAVKQMQAQKSEGSIVCITAALADNPIAGESRVGCDDDERRLERGSEKPVFRIREEQIRFNAVAPGVVDSPLHSGIPRELLAKLTPMASITAIEDVASAVVYLTEAARLPERCCTWTAVRTLENGNARRPGPAGAERRLTYVEAVQTGNLLFLTGMLLTEGRAAKFIGRVEAGLDVEDPEDDPMIPCTIITRLKPDRWTNSVGRCLRLATTEMI